MQIPLALVFASHDTFLSAQYLVNQWLNSYQIFMDIDFGDLDLIFKVTAVEKLKIHGCGTCFL